MKTLTIQFGIACTRCVDIGLEWAGPTLHRTTPEACAAIMQRPCEHPDEHHRARRRLILKVRVR